MLIHKLPKLQIRVPRTPTATGHFSFAKKCLPLRSSAHHVLSRKENSLYLFNGFVTRATNLDKEIKHAKQIIHREANVEDNKKFNDELKQLFSEGKYTDAFGKYDSFRRFQLVSAENIVLVMKHYMKLQRFGKVRDLFFHLKAHQAQPSLEIYELQMECTFLEKNHDKLVSFFKRMISDGWNPTDFVLQTVLRSHLRFDKLTVVEELIKEFQEKYNYQWNTSVLNEYITFACEKGNQARAEQFVLNNKLPRDELSYTRLIKFYLSYHALDKVEKAIEHLRQSNLHQMPFGIISDPRFQMLKIPKVIFRVSYTPEASSVGIAWEGGSRGFHLGAVQSEWEAQLLGFNAALSLVDINQLEEIAISYPAIINALSAANQKGMDEIAWSNTPFPLLFRNALKFLGHSPIRVKLTSISVQDPAWKSLAAAAFKAAKNEREHILFDPVINPSNFMPTPMAPAYIGLVEGITGSSVSNFLNAQ